jgi:hypothetical protein
MISMPPSPHGNLTPLHASASPTIPPAVGTSSSLGGLRAYPPANAGDPRG